MPKLQACQAVLASLPHLQQADCSANARAQESYAYVGMKKLQPMQMDLCVVSAGSCLVMQIVLPASRSYTAGAYCQHHGTCSMVGSLTFALNAQVCGACI